MCWSLSTSQRHEEQSRYSAEFFKENHEMLQTLELFFLQQEVLHCLTIAFLFISRTSKVLYAYFFKLLLSLIGICL